MQNTVSVATWKYNENSRYLKIFYQNGSAVLFYSVPHIIYQNFLRAQNKAAFIEKYLSYDLHFSHISIA
ncbi:KTSC domain-containing protein [Acinetobacter sp. MD2]|uniref:KTSC domain-containing protein n=1 Tax=Acinetobacter sp. MD2 TaxID=2600066 RepID=UPI002D1F9452|nr:KTSC domain-containing protein [Acinetobacter sp. MD2]MEB3766728.1 KTSC domain-containing protein [Acinetobacter sp. MD2]